MKPFRLFLPFFSVFLMIALVAGNSIAASEPAGETVTLEGVAPDKVDSLLAKMSDEQVRALLITELTKDLEESGVDDKNASGGLVAKFANWLHVLDADEQVNADNSGGIISAIVRLPGDYIAIVKRIGKGSFGSFIVNLALLVLVFAVAGLVEFIVHRLTANFSRQFKEKAIPDLDGPMRFIAGIMRSIPAFIHIFVFAVTAVLCFMMLPISDFAPTCSLFLAILFVVVFYRSINQLSLIICAPQLSSLRILSIDDGKAKILHHSALLLCAYTFSAIMLLGLLLDLQLRKPSFTATIIVAATGLIVMIIAMILRSRKYVQNSILEESDRNKNRNWITEQFAQFWHIPAIFYFAVVWMMDSAIRL